MNRWTAVAVTAALLQATSAAANEATAAHIRVVGQARIAEAFELAQSRSAAFRAIVDAIEASDTYVVIQDGACPGGQQVRSCVHLIDSTSSTFRAVLVRVDPRKTAAVVVAELAHELRHAAEIAAHPAVVDEPTLRDMYRTIGYLSCRTYQTECWETREAQAAERLVSEQIRRFQALTASKP